jgi:succinate dehydrogenase flavin-adding protein (antitoxin of CptAB toxin-antitoxin module)
MTTEQINFIEQFSEVYKATLEELVNHCSNELLSWLSNLSRTENKNNDEIKEEYIRLLSLNNNEIIILLKTFDNNEIIGKYRVYDNDIEKKEIKNNPENWLIAVTQEIRKKILREEQNIIEQNQLNILSSILFDIIENRVNLSKFKKKKTKS